MRWSVGIVAVTATLLTACPGSDPVEPGDLSCTDGGDPVIADLSPGQVFQATSAATCVELAQPSGRYVVAVTNTATAPGGFIGVQLRGLSGAQAAVAPSQFVFAPPRRSTLAVAAQSGLGDSHAWAHRIAHRDVMRRNMQLLRTLPASRPDHAMAATNVVAEFVNPTVGATSTLRMPDLDDQTATLCSEVPYDEIQVRTVYSSNRSIVVEDVNAPLAGQMDAMYVAMGEEFDQDMWPILTQNFGNPLAFDAQVGGNGRVVMVFSQTVNAFQRGVAGFVISCDFASRTQVPASNQGQYFYAIVPTSSGTGFGNELTRDQWRRLMRSTLIHEVKHIVAFAERLSRGAPAAMPFEDAWLEESTAMIAEELWARTVYDVNAKQNLTYQQSVFCDLRPSFPQCQDAPSVMFAHFLLLYDYLERVQALSPLGDPPGESGSTFYGSGWSFVRWAIDQYAANEATFLQPLTQGPLSGIANIEARTNRPWSEMLGHWSLANAVDDRPGFATQAPVTHPSWNYRNMYAALNSDLPNVFDRSYPLQPVQVSFGSFTQTVQQIAGGTAAIFELSGSAAPQQLLEVRNTQGGAPPSGARMAIVRVQ